LAWRRGGGSRGAAVCLRRGRHTAAGGQPATGHFDAHADPNPNPNAHAHADPNAHTHAYAHAHAYTYADTHIGLSGPVGAHAVQYR
jgi:hypothetical protein